MIALLAPALLMLATGFPAQAAATARPSDTAMHGTTSFEQVAEAAKRARDETRDDAAIESYRQGLKLKPEWDEGLWYLGTLLYEKENYFEACTALRSFLGRNPENGYGWALLGLSEFETRDYTRALDHLQQGMVIGLGDNRKMGSTVSYVTAILLTRSEKFDESMALLFTQVASGHNASPLIEPLGLAALRLPFLPAEIPADRREMVQMAGAAALAVEAQHYEEADKLFNELEARYPDQPGVHFLIGAYLLRARPDDGIKELKREIDISPSHVPARIRLAEEYIKRQDMSQSISFAQEALKLEPGNGLAHMVLGEALVAKGDPVTGIPELEIAQGSLPDELRIRWDLFRAYNSTQREEDAAREKGEIERLGKQDAAH
ncbi:MAG: tetratricopeptide repeat protein [Terracidiphilus sp.]